MVVSEETYDDYLKKIIDGSIDVSKLMEELETGIIHEEDDKYVVDSRWKIKHTSNRDIVLVSEIFMREVVAATYSVTEEWGGLIFGRVKHMKNNCTIFICERVAIMAQNRTAGSFEIKDEHYQTWGLSPQYIEFVGAGFKRIGWVHSHVNMGCFWSGTDDDTIKQLIAEEANNEIISLVVSKRTDKKLDTYYRPSNRGLRNGIEYLVPDIKTTVAPEQIYLEADMPAFDEIDAEYLENMKKIMDETEVIEVPVTSTWSAANGWADYCQSHGTTPAGVVTDIDIVAFVLLTSSYADDIRKILSTKKGNKRWKMKKIVKVIAKEKQSEHLMTMLDFFLKTPNRVQQYLIKYRNFIEVAKSFKKNIVNLCNASKSYRNFIINRYDSNWQDMFDLSLVKKTYKTTSSTTTSNYTCSDVRKSVLGWDEYVKNFDEKLLRKSITGILSVETPLYLELVEKIYKHIAWRVRSEEDKWPATFANMYVELKKVQKSIRKKAEREVYGEFLIRFLGETFEPYRTSIPKAKHGLQLTLNFLPDDLVLSFMYDFVTEFETEEELDQLYADGKIPVRRKMFGCPICKNWWTNKSDAKKCRDVCEKIEKKKGISTLKIAKPVDTTPKAQAAAANQQGIDVPMVEQTTVVGAQEKSGKAGISRPTIHVCGMALRYWQAENVCYLCGTEYKGTEGAIACMKKCDVQRTELAFEVLDKLDYYSCPRCEEAFINDVEYQTHKVSTCIMYGNNLHSLLLLFMMEYDDGWDLTGMPAFPEHCVDEFEDFVKKHWNTECGELILYPPIISWMLDKLHANRTLTVCADCGMNYNSIYEQLFSIYDCYWHEVNCKGRLTGPEIVQVEDLNGVPQIGQGFSDDFVEESIVAEFTKVQGFEYSYNCEMCNQKVVCRNPLGLQKKLIGHYVHNHGGYEKMTVSIQYPLDEPVKIEGKVNLIYRYKSYGCLECDSNMVYGTRKGLIKHLKDAHGIDGKAITTEYAIHISPQGEEEIKESYNDWLKTRFDGNLNKEMKDNVPLNQCIYCAIFFTASENMEENAHVCQRHEYVCGRRFLI